MRFKIYRLKISVSFFLEKYKKVFLRLIIFIPIVILLIPSIQYFYNTTFTQWSHTRSHARYIRRIESRLDNFTREDFLYDFDYLVYVLKTNFPSLGIIYRRYGVDMLALGDEIRAEMADESQEMNIERFIWLTRNDFLNRARQVGHLGMLQYAEYRWLISSYESAGMSWQFHLNVLNSLPSQAIYAHHRPLLDLFPEVIPWDMQTTIEMERIEYGRIAYLGVRRMAGYLTSAESRALADFFHLVRDYEHLIIDLRGNGGGSQLFFDHYITRSLIGTPISGQLYYFFMAGERNMHFMQDNLGSILKSEFEIDRLSQLVPNVVFSDYVQNDLTLMDYHFRAGHRVVPLPRHERNPFRGEIWMLIDGRGFSATQFVVDFHRYSGFATLVGETTGGMMGTPWHSVLFALPNTGLIIRYDPAYVINPHSSRPLEKGTEPHYFNRPGLDALETVLEMIKERSYE